MYALAKANSYTCFVFHVLPLPWRATEIDDPRQRIRKQDIMKGRIGSCGLAVVFFVVSNCIG